MGKVRNVRYVVAGVALLVAAIVVVTGAATVRSDSSSASAAPLPPLPSKAIAQLSKHGAAISVLSALGGSLGTQEAIAAASNATGLDPSSAVAASLAHMSTPGMGREDGHGHVTSRLFSNRPVWAIDYHNVTIPARGPSGTAGSYTTDMIVIVDASNGKFLVGLQYDPS